ncbi:MAG: 7,8-didemethyl-8-hydroxy-5-deazariboflavin synthase subunit CofG [Cyanobacteria bacterium P01_A01_bin.84]
MTVLDSRIVTYSPAYTIVPTYECFNRCSYCNFRTDPGENSMLSLKRAENIFKQLQNQQVCEILILSGEVHPHSPLRQEWFENIYNLCNLALSMGFLPHTNVGPLTFTEMEKLKTVNVSMGLMLEQITPQLLETVHRHAPSKIPEIRLQQLEWAGKLKIPFTTGLLLGIGENHSDRIETLEAISKLHQKFRHIQEVILQPHSPGSQQVLDFPAFNPNELPSIITIARDILPSDIKIQIPPNLVKNSQWLVSCIEAGARDLGGISPKDEVNPDYPHLNKDRLGAILQPKAWKLVPRLPVYSQYIGWLSPQLQNVTKEWLKKLTIVPV